MADQTEPVKRRVALKIIKPGMDTRQVIARFEAERQALAMMDHPNIAKILDAGTTDSGRPYFVMELVKGVPITQFCDEKHLTPRERLELFVPICQAIQHAHQKGVIHRDIKPTNVLVAKYDDRPVPKVIDFGVAKATEQRLTEKTMFTQFGQIVGTVDYMSPEQADLNQLDVDTRSDIYSLGVLLYELLTGETPFDRQLLRSAAFDELLRIIREEEPPRPSLRLSTSESLPSIAANRHIEPKKLSALVRGELDWIVMKALEKDRTRRYETAYGFADDIQRYLNDEPVVACPPSAAYRFRKFARRNKAALSTVAVVALALILGMVGTSWQAIRAMRAERNAVTERDRAFDAEKTAREEAARADKEAAIAKAVNEFLNEDLLSQADPENEPDRDIKLRTVVDRAAERIEGRFADQPLVEAAIRHVLGDTYRSLGEYEKAQQHHERAREVRERVLGPEHPNTLSSMHNVAIAIRRQGRYAEAEKLCREVLEVKERVLGPEDPETLKSMHNLAIGMERQGRYAEAEKLCREVLEVKERVLGPEDPETLKSMHNLGVLMHRQARYAEAEKLYREVLEINQRVLGPEHPKTLCGMHTLAILTNIQGDHKEAEKRCREVLGLSQRVLGCEHPSTLNLMQELGNAINGQRRYAEAENLLRELLEIQRRVLGDEHPDTLRCMVSMAFGIGAQGRHQDAEKMFREALGISRRVLGPEHPETLDCMHRIAHAIEPQGRHTEAEKLYREALEIQSRVLGPEHPDTRRSMYNLAALYTNLCWKLATATEVSERDPAKAVELANLAIELRPDSANNWNNLGVAQYRAGDCQAAVDALERADAMIEGGDREHRLFLAMAYWQLGDKEEARELYAQGAAWVASNRKSIRFRAEAEEVMEINEEDRKRLIEEYLARQVDKTREGPNEKPNEKPNDEGIDTRDQGAKKVEREEQDTDP